MQIVQCDSIFYLTNAVDYAENEATAYLNFNLEYGFNCSLADIINASIEGNEIKLAQMAIM